MVNFYLPHRNPLLMEGVLLTSISPCLIVAKRYIVNITLVQAVFQQ